MSASFTCPRCGHETHHPVDVDEGYCGVCHAWTRGVAEQGARDFDRYCDEHGIQPGEVPAAFAAWLHERTGWDGPMSEVPDAPS